jgi:2'-5' RNA ligase superfamily
MRFIAYFIFFLFPTTLLATPINVYLTLDKKAIYKEIHNFNQFLKNQGLYQQYQIKPFADNHPMHITLYLTQYPEENLLKLIEKTKLIAKGMQAFDIKATRFFLSSGNFIMLGVNLNKHIQALSDKVVLQLHPLRDSKAKIPFWVKQDPRKRHAFTRYGSPNVFFEFSPHISISAKHFTDSKRKALFKKQLQNLIDQYHKKIKQDNLKETIVAIGIGLADEQGQVTKKIASIPFG